MNIIFRVDAAPQLGGGHLFRCITLAGALKARGAQCLFVLRDHIGVLSQYLEQSGYQLALLPRTEGHSIDVSSYQTWVGASWEVDSRQTYQAAEKTLSGDIDWVIVDHYGLDEKWEHYFSTKGIKIGVIDDLVNRAHRSEFLLDQTCGRDSFEYQNLVGTNTELFVGERYCLLRSEFFEARDKSLKKRSEFKGVNKLLVNFGSTDPTGHTLKALKGLTYFAVSRSVEVHVLVGSACPYLSEIESLALCLTYRVVLHIDSERVADLISEVDLAIGAAGGSTWERCFLGLPTLLVKTAENQTDVVNRVISSGAAQGYFQSLEDEYSLASALIELERQYIQVARSAFRMSISDDLNSIISLIFGE